MNSRVGQPFCHCQNRWGANPAAAPPNHNMLVLLSSPSPSTTVAAPENAGRSRSAQSESPSAARTPASTAIENGGWSTYPQARCLLQAM